MPLSMDVHRSLPKGASAVASAHRADVAIEGRLGVTDRNYWVDDQASKVSCLNDAPTIETGTAVHREAHGLLVHEIFEVVQG